MNESAIIRLRTASFDMLEVLPFELIAGSELTRVLVAKLCAPGIRLETAAKKCACSASGSEFQSGAILGVLARSLVSPDSVELSLEHAIDVDRLWRSDERGSDQSGERAVPVSCSPARAPECDIISLVAASHLD
jgi:hypothetical protein